MSVLHTIKAKASPEDLSGILVLMDDHIASLLGSFPDPSSMIRLKTGLAGAPELYFSDMLHAYKEKGYEQISLEKGSPLAVFNANNDIDELQNSIAALPDDTKELGTSKENVLKAIAAYKEIVAVNRVRNLLNAHSLDLSKTVAGEIKAAGDSSGIVPTSEQEVSIRDGLAWLSSNSTVSTGAFEGWGFLRGIAGTGKTSVAVKWLLDLSGLKPDEVIASAGTDTAAGVLAGAGRNQPRCY